MAKITVELPERARAYMKAHGLTADQYLQHATDAYARERSLGDAPGRATRISRNSGNVIVKNITHGDVSVSVLSHLKFLLRVAMRPESTAEAMGQQMWKLGFLVGAAVTATALCSYIFSLG